MFLNTVFGFSLDFSFWSELINQPVIGVVADLFALFGWVIVSMLFFYGAVSFWLVYKQNKYIETWDWVVLAVDVPDVAVQTPKAVEQIFAHLSGAYSQPNVKQKYWDGQVQKYFSFEIVSIGGYIQFLIRTEEEYRDLVEAVIYAQYPEAEITEVEDYVDYIPNKYPDEKHNILGVDFKLEQDNSYPIRTYPDFKYDINPDVTFSDPMAALLENFTRIGSEENLWFQIIIVPIDSSWKEKGIELVKKLITGKEGSGGGVLNKFGDVPRKLANDLVEHGWRTESMSGEIVEKKDQDGKVSDLSPGNRKILEAIENKISKVGFKTKIRLLYASSIDNFNYKRCVQGVIGAMNQFTIQSSNGIVAGRMTFRKKRKNPFVFAFKKRLVNMGVGPCILNIEELATLWHFPMPFVKTPLVQKSYAKRVEPPSDLPMDLGNNPFKQVGITRKVKAPENLPGDLTEELPGELPVENLPVDKNLPIVQDAPPENLPFG